MVDKVKPLGIESSATGGSEDEQIPTEMNPLEDYAVFKGIAFQNSDSFLLENIGRTLIRHYTDETVKPTINGSGEVTVVAFYNSATQINANRVVQVDISYDSNHYPTSEVWKIYDTNGTTVLRTITLTPTFTSGDLTNMGEVTT